VSTNGEGHQLSHDVRTTSINF